MASAKEIGKNIRKFRLAAGLSQNDLVALSGLEKPRISRYENGHHVPSIQTLERLAKALGVKPNEIVGW